ncbi:DEAD/DEAH box helicase [Trueperella bernardiae]|uniref:DEAD/DEAH box helicase n=1 Tax=Trueperella bernardiae TaxID=59561 RepID=UPI000C7B586F|nr:DEAD/DEAH box helicase [Trueperella bernardiae]PKZ89976.1 DEAD/DEAH box helicase [Trueperella bernardiae]
MILENFVDRYRTRGIVLDDFQLDAIEALESRDVLVSAPTGAGKTVVAEYAVELALARSKRCIYTAPIKALSNQKYRDLAGEIGEDYVGLLTGDQTINRDAPILVVTTEVLRNMLFQRDEIVADIGYVVLDEVHYLSDEFRGPVWEEIILQLPAHARLVSLSATISNVEEFASWLRSVRGVTEVVVSRERPVPLVQHVAISRRLEPLFAGGEINQRLVQADASLSSGRRRRPTSFARRKRVLNQLQDADLLPAIEFIFSRKGCDRAVGELLDSGITLNSAMQQREVRARLRELRADLSEEDQRAVRFGFWAKAMTRGFCAHHAGMFPALKELAEDLMEDGLLKLVYATGTLALGIDMPVRTVVLEELQRWNGADFVPLTATEYTQLIGRAGRRGKDKVGHAVVMHTDELDIQELADLGSGRVEPLQSAFFPSYNSVVNLLAFHPYEDARAIMGTSFAQYQRNAELGEVRGRIARVRARLEEVEAELAGECRDGSLPDYLRLRRTAKRASKAERKRAKREYRKHIADSWDVAATGRLYAFARGGELDYGVVLSVGPKLRLVDLNGDMAWLREEELSSELRDLGTIPMPFGLSPRKVEVRANIADAMWEAVGERIELGTDRDLTGSWDRFAVTSSDELDAHPVHHCPDLTEHIRTGSEFTSLLDNLEQLEADSEAYDDSVAKEFDATAGVLARLGYLQPGAEGLRTGMVKLATGAAMLRGIHNEADLLIVQSLAEAAFAELTPEEFAGACSAFLCDRRLGTDRPTGGALRASWQAIERNVEFLHRVEESFGIVRTPEPFSGGIDAFAAWASRADLESVLAMGNLVVGDFISANRRLIDLLGQIEQVAPAEDLRDLAGQAVRLIRRWQWL